MKLILGSKLVSQEAPESIRKASMLVFTSMFATATQAAVLTGFLKVPKARHHVLTCRTSSSAG